MPAPTNEAMRTTMPSDKTAPAAPPQAAPDPAVPQQTAPAPKPAAPEPAIMGPVAPNVRKSMKGNKRANTKPEQVVRQMLRNAGFPGYRLQWKKCPGHPDIAFPGRKLAFFVHGCFWHRCPVCNLPVPKSNVDYWVTKFRKNQERDQRVCQELKDAGWTVVTIWEHELKKKNLPATQQFVYEIMTLETPEERQTHADAHQSQQIG